VPTAESIENPTPQTLLDILEETLKTVRVEEHRTDALRAKEVVHAREEALEALVRQVRAAGPG